MEITLTEALAKLKLLDKKIDSKLRSLRTTGVVDVVVGKDNKGRRTLKTEEEIKNNATSLIQSIQSLMKNKNALKAKIAQKNAETFVEINGAKYTVVEAIERKRLIGREKDFIMLLERQVQTAKNEVMELNEEASDQVSRLIESKLSSDSKKTEDTSKLSQELMELYKARLVDPANVEKLVEEMKESIEEFETNVDVALSVVNAQTKIEVDFE